MGWLSDRRVDWGLICPIMLRFHSSSVRYAVFELVVNNLIAKIYNLYSQVCSKMFKAKLHLRYHMRTHTGERPYKCRYCDHAFANNTNYRRHEMTHTGRLQQINPVIPQYPRFAFLLKPMVLCSANLISQIRLLKPRCCCFLVANTFVWLHRK